MATHNEFGKQGEELAGGFLVKNGYQILAKNYRYKKAEIDIIALKDSLLCIVEVKSRSSDYFMDPQDAVTAKKIKLLMEATNAYVDAHDLDYEIRFDIITVLKENQQFNIQHLKNAFYHF